MAIEMVLFDFREEEKAFFENNKFPNFNFTFYEWSLTPASVKNLLPYLPAKLPHTGAVIESVTEYGRINNPDFSASNFKSSIK